MKKKKCSICKEEKSLEDFYSQKKTNKDGETYIYHYPYCKHCTIKKSDKWNRTHKEERKKIQKREDIKPHNVKRTREWSRVRRENGEYKKWQENNKDKLKGYNEKRKTKEHKITKEEWAECLNYFDNSCAYCGMTEGQSQVKYNKTLHKEHVQHDGSNEIDNCVPSCQGCNSSKNIFDMETWYRKTNFFSEARLDKINKWLQNNKTQ